MKVLKSLLVIAIVTIAAGSAAAVDQAAQPAQPPQSPTAPIKGTVGFSFMSDYVWRGINLTDVLGGHEGTGAYMGTYGLGVDLVDLSPEMSGKVSATFQQVYFKQYDNTDAHLAMNDFAINYTNYCPFMNGDWTLGYRYYKFENVPAMRHSGLSSDSQEVSAQFAWHDGEFFKCITGEDMGTKVLHPTVTYIYDYELAQGGLLMGSLSHPFDLSEASPELAGLSLTPSVLATVDNRYYGGLTQSLAPVFPQGISKTTRLAYLEYGLNLGANLSKMLGITYGTLKANVGCEYYNTFEQFMEDGWVSYMNVSYNW